MTAKYDVVVIGGGPGGATVASLLAQKRVSVALIEKDSFPRFKIGESLLPYSMDILQESGAFEKLTNGKYIRKNGAQFIDHRKDNEVYFDFQNGLDGKDRYAFEVERSEFDQDLLSHAQSEGVTVYQPEKVLGFEESADEVFLTTNQRSLSASFVVDATGRAALLGQQFKVRQRSEDFNNIAVFTHYKGVKRNSGRKEGDILIGILPENAWSWHIPFQGDLTSVGIVCDAKKYSQKTFDEKFIQDQLSCHPKLSAIMSDATSVREVQTVSNYSHRCHQLIDRRWLLIGDAACFLDPVFSSGIHVSLKSAQMAAQVVGDALKAKANLLEVPSGQNYEKDLLKGVMRFRSLLKLFYETDFMYSMQKVLKRKNILQAFTSVVGGDMWNEDNVLFQRGVLRDHI